MKLSGKRVLITGGGSGIGLVMAEAMLKIGAEVFVCGRTESRLLEAQTKHPALKIQVCDVTCSEDIAALVKQCEEWGGLDVLVNNAGIYHEYDFTSPDTQLQPQLDEINIGFQGPVRMVHAFLPGLLKRSEAAIVNVSSGLAFVPLVRGPIYSATKAAVHAWTRSLRKQLEATSVSVFELMPPVTDTELVRDFDVDKESPQKVVDALLEGIRKGKVEITPGPSKQLRFMSRFAPGFIFKMLNQG